jgi:hypothetical protein
VSQCQPGERRAPGCQGDVSDVLIHVAEIPEGSMFCAPEGRTIKTEDPAASFVALLRNVRRSTD